MLTLGLACSEVRIGWDVLTRLELKKKKSKGFAKLKVERNNMEVIRLSVSAGKSLAHGQEMSALLGMWASGDLQKQDFDSYLRAQLIPLTRQNDTQGSAVYTEKVRSSWNACGRSC